jgi:hypothetical protein
LRQRGLGLGLAGGERHLAQRVMRADRQEDDLRRKAMQGRAGVQHLLAVLAVASPLHLEQQPAAQPRDANAGGELIQGCRADERDAQPGKAIRRRAALADRPVELQGFEEAEPVLGKRRQALEPRRRINGCNPFEALAKVADRRQPIHGSSF